MKMLKKHGVIVSLLLRVINKFFMVADDCHHSVRCSALAYAMNSIGSNVRFDKNVYVNQPQNITIGNNVFVGKDCFLNAYDPIYIGNYCSIAAGCKLITANHRFDDLDVPINNQGHEFKPITLEEDVWLGYDVIVLPGVCLGKGCVVAAGSVVTKSFEAYSVIAGVPARQIKSRRKSDTGNAK